MGLLNPVLFKTLWFLTPLGLYSASPWFGVEWRKMTREAPPVNHAIGSFVCSAASYFHRVEVISPCKPVQRDCECRFVFSVISLHRTLRYSVFDLFSGVCYPVRHHGRPTQWTSPSLCGSGNFALWETIV